MPRRSGRTTHQSGWSTPQTDRDAGKKRYAYDPHIDPALQFDSQGAEVEEIIDAGLAADELEDAKAALAELKRRREPYLNWAGKAVKSVITTCAPYRSCTMPPTMLPHVATERRQW